MVLTNLQRNKIIKNKLQPVTGVQKPTHAHKHTLFYLTLRRLSTDMEDAGFCGRGMMGVVANLGRGGGSGGGGGWYHEGWWGGAESEKETVAPFTLPFA